MTIFIRVPATTANLGPGFDCLGLALDLWNEVRVDLIGADLAIRIEGESADHLPTDSSNLIYSSMLEYACSVGQELPAGLSLSCKNRIPMGSGLGSSSAAIVAGILAARALLGLPADPDRELECAALIEGHPDNVAPCLLGGLTAVSKTADGFNVRRYNPTDLNLAIVLPDFDFPTTIARAALPKNIPMSDAIHNLSRIPGLIDALTSGHLANLHDLMDDRLHQPYRLPLIPGAERAMDAAYTAGADGVALSGAGPALLIICADKEILQLAASSMIDQFHEAKLSCRSFFPGVSYSGARASTSI
jgi:homoserine kinase